MKAGMMCCGLLASHLAYATSFGVVGETFPVAEMSFLTLIESRLTQFMSNGTWDLWMTSAQQRAEQAANRPRPLGITRAMRNHHHHYDPTVTLTQPIVDEHDHVLQPAGSKINGLTLRPDYQPCWLFFNEEDTAQVRWVQQQTCTNPTLILTGGVVSDAEHTLNAVIYFDQGGRLTERLGIQSLPARVTREGDHLLITEVLIQETGDAI